MSLTAVLRPHTFRSRRAQSTTVDHTPTPQSRSPKSHLDIRLSSAYTTPRPPCTATSARPLRSPIPDALSRPARPKLTLKLDHLGKPVTPSDAGCLRIGPMPMSMYWVPGCLTSITFSECTQLWYEHSVVHWEDVDEAHGENGRACSKLIVPEVKRALTLAEVQRLLHARPKRPHSEGG